MPGKSEGAEKEFCVFYPQELKLTHTNAQKYCEAIGAQLLQLDHVEISYVRT